MTIYNLYIFDRHCQCIYFQKWAHKNSASSGSGSSNSISQTGSMIPGAMSSSSSRLGGLTTSSTRFSTSSPASSSINRSSTAAGSRGGGGGDERLSQTQPNIMSGLAAGSVISIEEEAKLVYGVIYSLRNFVRKLSSR